MRDDRIIIRSPLSFEIELNGCGQTEAVRPTSSSSSPVHEYAVASRRVRLSRLRGNARMHVGADLDNNLSSHSLQSQAGVREVGHRKSGDPAALCHGRDLSTGVMIPFFFC